jgi:hypothetical protein
MCDIPFVTKASIFEGRRDRAEQCNAYFLLESGLPPSLPLYLSPIDLGYATTCIAHSIHFRWAAIRPYPCPGGTASTAVLQCREVRARSIRSSFSLLAGLYALVQNNDRQTPRSDRGVVGPTSKGAVLNRFSDISEISVSIEM